MAVDKDKSTVIRGLGAILLEQRDDADNRRRLVGKYAPEPGVCRICKEKVVPVIDFPNDGRIGGPPVQGFIKRWECSSCFIVYARCPPKETEHGR